MIKLEHVVQASPEQMEFIIEGMRNPMNSWDKSDSMTEPETIGDFGEEYGSIFSLGKGDHSLMQRLAKAGTDHRKFMRMMPVYVRITAPLYWWKEFDTYKVGTVANSCSTMHKIQDKEFTLGDFSCEHLSDSNIYCYPLGGGWRGLPPLDTLKATIELLNNARERYLEALKVKDKRGLLSAKDIWWQMIQLLPSSYNQTRNVMMNYEVLANIYKSRIHHKLDEWRLFCKWIEGLPYSELIISADIMEPKEMRKEVKSDSSKLDIRWAEDIFKNHGIKLTEEQIDTINSISTTNIITSEEMVNVYGQLVPKKDVAAYNMNNYEDANFNGEE